MFSNKVNKLQRCHNLVNGRDSWGNFCGKRSSLIFHVICILAYVAGYLHIFIYIMHLTKIPTWKFFMVTPTYGKIKSRKSPWVKKTKKPAQRRKKKLYFVKQRKKPCQKRQLKALGLAKRLRQAWHLLKIQSIRKTLLAAVFPSSLPLASLPIITWSSWFELHWVR